MSRSRKQPRVNIEDVIKRLASWTHEDEQLVGLSDPLGTTTDGIPDDLAKMFEQSFMEAIANDHEYWQERTARVVSASPPMSIESMLDSTQIDLEVLAQIMQDQQPKEPAPPMKKRRWSWLHKTTRR